MIRLRCVQRQPARLGKRDGQVNPGRCPVLTVASISRVSHRDAISLEREASRACCRGDPVTVMNVEEWGILLITVPMFRRTNAAGGVKNRPAEDGRVNVVEPRAREALKVSSSRKHSGGSEA